jgi:hypothetical protein
MKMLAKEGAALMPIAVPPTGLPRYNDGFGSHEMENHVKARDVITREKKMVKIFDGGDV